MQKIGLHQIKVSIPLIPPVNSCRIETANIFNFIVIIWLYFCKTDSETKKEIVADTTTNYNNSLLTDTGTALQPEMELAAPVKTTTSEVQKNKITPKNNSTAFNHTGSCHFRKYYSKYNCNPTHCKQ